MSTASSSSVQQISREEYESQAVEYTTQQVEQLNADVRRDPALGAKSTFFQSAKNVEDGIPVFQGKHTRFVYDDDDKEIVDAVDVTQEAINAGPYVRTIEDLGDDEDEGEGDEEADDDDEDIADEVADDNGSDDAVANTFYPQASDSSEQEDEQMDSALEDSDVVALLDDVAMELASVALDEKALLARANSK